MKKLILLIAVVLIAACSQKIEGTYINDTNGRSLTFHSDGTVIASNNVGAKIDELKFTVDGENVKVGPAFIFTISKDGSLNGGAAHGRYVKK